MLLFLVAVKVFVFFSIKKKSLLKKFVLNLGVKTVIYLVFLFKDITIIVRESYTVYSYA